LTHDSGQCTKRRLLESCHHFADYTFEAQDIDLRHILDLYVDIWSAIESGLDVCAHLVTMDGAALITRFRLAIWCPLASSGDWGSRATLRGSQFIFQ
jgi:hypothetical protein